MRVLLIERQYGGHRMHFVGMICDAISNYGVEITLATSRAATESDEFQTHLTSRIDRVQLDASLPDLDCNSSHKAIAQASFSALREVITRYRPEHVYIPYGDGLTQICGIRRLLGRSIHRNSMEIEAILMRGRFAYPSDGWRDSLFARLWLMATTAAPFDRLHFLDPIPYEFLQRLGGKLAARAKLIPEPVEPMIKTNREDARRKLGLPVTGRIICCPGALDERKGIDRAIRAFAKSSIAKDDRLLLAGKMEPSVQSIFEEYQARNPDRFIAINRCLTDQELHLSMCAADVVATPYPRHIGSSGIVVRAAILNRMVLGSDYGWVGMVINRFALGLTCDCASVEALSTAMENSLETSATFTSSPQAQHFTRFHTQSNFAKHIAIRLAERMGRRPIPVDCHWTMTQ